MTKILHLPLNVPGSEQNGQRKGMIEVFDEVIEFDYLQKMGELGKPGMNFALLNLVEREKPDLCWLQLQETGALFPDTLNEMIPNMFMTQWMGDIRVNVPPYQQEIGKYFNITYIGFDQVKEYEEFGNDVEIMMIAVDPDEVVPPPQKKEKDVVFIGNHYQNGFLDTKMRLDLVKHLRETYHTRVLGNGWPDGLSDGSIPLKQQGIEYAKGSVCISINHFNNLKYYSERLLWCLASGTPTVAFRTPDLEFVEGKHYLGFETISECCSQIDKIICEDVVLDTNSARAEILENHTWTNRFKQLKTDYEHLM